MFGEHPGVKPIGPGGLPGGAGQDRDGQTGGVQRDDNDAIVGLVKRSPPRQIRGITGGLLILLTIDCESASLPRISEMDDGQHFRYYHY